VLIDFKVRGFVLCWTILRWETLLPKNIQN
jgi:hypothetical protein